MRYTHSLTHTRWGYSFVVFFCCFEVVWQWGVFEMWSNDREKCLCFMLLLLSPFLFNISCNARTNMKRNNKYLNIACAVLFIMNWMRDCNSIDEGFVVYIRIFIKRCTLSRFLDLFDLLNILWTKDNVLSVHIKFREIKTGISIKWWILRLLQV